MSLNCPNCKSCTSSWLVQGYLCREYNERAREEAARATLTEKNNASCDTGNAKLLSHAKHTHD